MQDADAILHVKTGELNADVLIANVIGNLSFRKMNLLYLLILFGDQYSAEVLHHKNPILYKKYRKSIMRTFFSTKTQHFQSLKIFGIIELFKFCTMLANIVCNIIQ